MTKLKPKLIKILVKQIFINICKTLVYLITILVIRLAVLLFFDYTIMGKKNIPKNKKVIFACAHKIMLDIPLLLPLSFKIFNFIAKKELWEMNKYLSAWLDATDTIPLDREQHDNSTLDIASDFVKRNHILVIFPEGTRNPDKLTKLHSGVINIAKKGSTLESDVVIIPISIHYEKKPKFSLFRPYKITVVCAKGISTNENTRGQIKRKLKNSLETIF